MTTRTRYWRLYGYDHTGRAHILGPVVHNCRWIVPLMTDAAIRLLLLLR